MFYALSFIHHLPLCKIAALCYTIHEAHADVIGCAPLCVRPVMAGNDSEQSVVVGVIRDLTTRLEAYERHADQERKQFQETVVQLVSNLRRDMHRAITPIQIDQIEHARTHDADRVERSNRQAETDRRMSDLQHDIRQLRYLLIGITCLMAIAVGILVVRFA
jgi:hypothetical protein